MEGTLGRIAPTDDDHVRKYPITLETIPATKVPVVMGTNWYSNFDDPVQDNRGRWWIGYGNLGTIRGGHAYAFLPKGVSDPRSWYEFYNQGQEGACVGFAASRAMSLMNRTRYNARWLYTEAQKVDEWPGEDYSGTSVRAAMDVLRNVGHVKTNRKGTTIPDAAHGILRNRWARSVDEVIACLGSPEYYDIGGVPLLNSWGKGYPHLTWMPLETVQRLINEHGEATIITDK